MSKKVKLVVILLIVIVIGGGVWLLLKPKAKDNFVEREISIKQAGIEKGKTLTYEDTSGFSFDYPSDLTVQEIELENNTVYSSLELLGSEPGKLTIRISDTQYPDLKTWQKDLETKEVINEVRPVNWDDLTAVEFSYGAPKLRKTAAVDSKVIYELEAPADNGYWDKIRESILSSLKFDQSVFINQPTSVDDEVILLEEVIE
ncbi:hypothetical protein KKE48_02670 [Patescibacteria group bacterium]|nr:hypothetical protein [Patescibacteria group bacterium]MBU1499748.1 hypothetical protein [Patescibacteria group bacterium]